MTPETCNSPATEAQAENVALDRKALEAARLLPIGSERHEVIAAYMSALPSSELNEAATYAQRLAVGLWQKHHSSDAPEWKPLSGDLVGLLTQIDNMVASLVAAPALPQDVAALTKALTFHGRYASESNEDCQARKNSEREQAASLILSQSAALASAREVIDGLLKTLKAVEFRSYEPGEATDDEKTIRFEARPVVVAAREWQRR